jgi:tetratricopeptide (TPR) repeat protein
MSTDNTISKVQLLILQNRYDDALKVLNSLLREDPSNAIYLLMLAEVKYQQDYYDEAMEVINNAISIEPGSASLFFLKAKIAFQKDLDDEAIESIDIAINLDPLDADYHAMKAHIFLHRKKFKESLELADRALSMDAENILALNTRSTALVKLNRKEESFETIEGALREDPNNEFTHANYGWGLLEQGNHKKALEHFNEALKNNPNYEYAQAGLLEALKAKNVFYRLFLKYAFFMDKLTSKFKWGVIIGFYLLFRILRSVAKENEALAPFITPLLILMGIIAFSTWVITPISNLFLRFNKYGKLLLDKKERMSSNFVAVSFALFVLGILLSIFTKQSAFISLIIFGFGMMLPYSVMFAEVKIKNSLMIFTVLLTIIGLTTMVLSFVNGTLYGPALIVFMFSYVGFQWFANFNMISD